MLFIFINYFLEVIERIFKFFFLKNISYYYKNLEIEKNFQQFLKRANKFPFLSNPLILLASVLPMPSFNVSNSFLIIFLN